MMALGLESLHHVDVSELHTERLSIHICRKRKERGDKRERERIQGVMERGREGKREGDRLRPYILSL